jgi:Domain of unknown function (DUF6249)
MNAGFYILLGILGSFTLTFCFIIALRYLEYRETLALAEKGLVRGDRTRGSDGKDSLRWGIVITAVGLALCLGLYPIGLLPGNSFPLGLGPWLLAGLLPLFFGLGLILIFVLTQEPKEDKPSLPPPPKE